MAETLRSIAAKIPWSLLIKTGAFVLLWRWLPWYLAAPSALALYLVPRSSVRESVVPLVATLAIAASAPRGLFFGFVSGVLFGMTLGVKEFAFRDRLRAYHLFIVFALFAAAPRLVAGGAGPVVSPILILGGAFFYALLADFLRQAHAQLEAESVTRLTPRIIAALLAFLFAETVAVAGFLPMNVLYKAALVLLAGAALTDVAHDYMRARHDPARMFSSFAIYFVFLLVLLLSNPWNP